MKHLIKSLVPHLPEFLLVRVLKLKPVLLGVLPSGCNFVWPYYLGERRIYIDTSNPIETEILSGTYDKASTLIIKNFVKAGDVCMDVGANIGALTLLLAELVGDRGSVYAVEPGPPYVQRLHANLALNPPLKKRVEIIPYGLSDAAGELTWRDDPEHPYNAVLLDIFFPEQHGIKVPVRTIDSFNLSKLNFIKIDVEGMELEVLRGGTETLRRLRPVVLFETMELFREARGFDIFAEIESLLRDSGYSLFSFDGTLKAVTSKCLPWNTLALPVQT